MSDDREQRCSAPALPSALSERLDGYRWARDLAGESGAAVYRLSKPTAPDLYLKHGLGPAAADLTAEQARLSWLAPHIAVPTVDSFVSRPDEAWLLIEALPGQTAYQRLECDTSDRLALVDAIARFTRRLHAIPIARCPFDSGHRLRLAQARDRVAAGLVDTNDFDEERRGMTADQLWTAITALPPFTPDPVVTHGDFSLDNILMRDGDVIGCIDVGRAGITDRYQDLAILWNCLGEFDAALQGRLFESYGIAAPDPRKLEFHLMLDEFF